MNDFEVVPDLGPFEQQIMLAVLMLGDGTYGAPVYQKVEEIAGKRVNQGAFYTTLDRMEQKGYLTSKATDPKKEPRGRPRYLLTMTPMGKKRSSSPPKMPSGWPSCSPSIHGSGAGRPRRTSWPASLYN